MYGRLWRLAPWLAATLILLLPLAAMQFTAEVAWGAGDFAVVGGLLFGACGVYEFVARKTGNRYYRAAAGIALVTALLLIWINLAVGIIGSEGNPANLIFGGVLAVGLVGAIIVRFRPGGMARVSAATAFAQAMVGMIAVAARLDTGTNWPAAMMVLTAVLASLWLASAWLFRKAAQVSLSSPLSPPASAP